MSTLASIKPINKNTENVLLYVLGFILFIRLTSYLTFFPDSITLTRLFKIGLRFAMTGFCIFFIYRFRPYHPEKRIHVNMLLPIGFYMLYLLMGLASVFWTTNISYTLIQWGMTSENLVFGILFYQCLLFYESVYHKEEPLIANMLGMGIFLMGLVFLYGYYFNPEDFNRQTHGGEVSRLGGLIINPNELGMLMVVGVAAIGHDWLRRGFGYAKLLGFLVCTTVLLLTQSRSSLISYFLVVGLFVVKSNYYWLKIGSVAAAFAVVPVVFQKIFLKEGNWEEVASLTDRLPFWKDLLMYNFPESPLIGFGFMSISPNSFTNKFNSLHAYAGAMTHNTFIQVLINLGLIGATICLLQMVFTFYAIGSSKNNSLKQLSLSLLIPLMINSLTEFGIFGETNHGILFYVFIILFFTFSIQERKQV